MAGFCLYCLVLFSEIFTFVVRSSESRILTEASRFQAMAPYIMNADALLGPNPGGGAPGITHHSVGRSEAGGDVILVGFATALLVTVFCYIRITRTRKDTYES
ncbi:hypothetical protein F511_21502 [Dorcoceras hygrometricum]|uniref:Uncharacterized protein n=1 Tax=Dorcoceras hygrometricum TaxID=472368 RepID=A0A2Z7D1X4_9LAMI|nr:hypothetical protein F511_21502 [Dorcoceras hygrometricum]